MSRARRLASGAGSAVRYASRTTGVNFEKYLTWGAIIGVGYVALKALGFIGSVKSGLNEFGSAVGTTLYDWFHPNEVGEKLFYIVRFPDGQFHSVPSLTVANDGTFTNKGTPPLYIGDGKVYRIAIGTTVFKNPNNASMTTNKQAVPV